MGSEVDTGRLEAFSDGVFAIAITLLILEVRVADTRGPLTHRLAEQWPSYVSFLVSFMIIGIIWINHHQMFHDIRASDHGLVVCNLGLLLVVSVIPFPTKVMGDELRGGAFADQRTAALLYGLTFVALSVMFNALWLWAAYRRRLIEPDVPQPRVDARTRRSLLGIPSYALATLLAFWSPEVSIALYGGIALSYLLPGGWLDRLLVPELRSAAATSDPDVRTVDPS
jgi:uncharacterized membrane protein